MLPPRSAWAGLAQGSDTPSRRPLAPNLVRAPAIAPTAPRNPTKKKYANPLHRRNLTLLRRRGGSGLVDTTCRDGKVEVKIPAASGGALEGRSLSCWGNLSP